MKQIIRVFVPLILVAVVCNETWAHPGHGQSGAAHYITEPEHSVVTIAALLVAGLIWLAMVRPRVSAVVPRR